MSDKEVREAEAHFKSASNKAEASTFLIQDVQSIVKASAGDRIKVLNDLAKLNDAIDLKAKGFPEDFTVVMARESDKLIVADSKRPGNFLLLDNKGEQRGDSCSPLVTAGKDGAVIKDYGNYKETSWKDGTVKLERMDGTGVVTKADGSSHHWGPRLQDNFERMANGSIVRYDSDGNAWIKPGWASSYGYGHYANHRRQLPYYYGQQQDRSRYYSER